MKVGVIGGGTVGRATARTYLEFADQVCVYDLLPERSTHPLKDVIDCDVVFVCLPTPGGSDGRLDLTAVTQFFSELVRRPEFYPDRVREINFVLKSTVPIGTTRFFRETYGLTNLVHSPEFLTARCAQTDAMLPAQLVIGYPSARGWMTIEKLYRDRFPGIPVVTMTSDESEALKLFLNGFFAVKVAYFNEVRSLADKLGLDWDVLLRGMLGDGRIAPYHCNVPGPDGKRGFGGYCLPKDLKQLINEFKPDLAPYLCAAADYRNWAADRKEGDR